MKIAKGQKVISHLGLISRYYPGLQLT